MREKRETRLGMVVIGLTAALMAGAPVLAGTTKTVTITPNCVLSVPFALTDETSYVIVGYAQGCKILTGRVDVETGLMDWEDAVGPGGQSVTFQGSPLAGFTGPVDRLWMYAKLAGELSVEGEGEEPGPPPTYTINTAKTALWCTEFTAQLSMMDTEKWVVFYAEGGCNPVGMLMGMTTGVEGLLGGTMWKWPSVSGEWGKVWGKEPDDYLELLGESVTLTLSFAPNGPYPTAQTGRLTTIQ